MGDFAHFYLPSNLAKFPFQNQLKKFMQVEVDVKCMHNNFGGHSLFGFGDIAPFHFPSKFQFGLVLSIEWADIIY